MRKFVFIFTFLVFCSALVSCGVSKADFESFKKDNAITNYNSRNYNISKSKSDYISIYGDYYEQNNEYYSLFTNFNVGSYIDYEYINNNKIYYNNNGQAYDAFGSLLPSWFNNNLSYSKSYYLIVAENSPFYNFISKIESKEKTLHLIQIDGVKDIWSECGYIIKDNGDTHFLARNVFSSLSEFGISESDLIPSSAAIEKLNDIEYSVTYNSQSYRFKYSKSNHSSSNYDTYVKKSNVYDSGTDDEYTTLFEIELANNNSPFTYKVKKVSGYSNDFSFVYNGVKYKVKCENGYNQKTDIDFYPVDYLTSKNNDYCYVLCHKADDDGNLSNKYYVVKIDSNFNFSKFTDDISLFDDSQYILFNGKYETLQEGERLVALNDSAMITKRDGSLYFKTSNYSNSLFDSPSLVNYFSVDNKYIFKGYDDNNDKYYLVAFDYNNNIINTYNCDSVIISDFCVYEVDDKIMFFDEVLHYGSNCRYSTNEVGYSVFGSSHKTYVLKITENYSTVANYVFSLDN